MTSYYGFEFYPHLISGARAVHFLVVFEDDEDTAPMMCGRGGFLSAIAAGAESGNQPEAMRWFC